MKTTAKMETNIFDYLNNFLASMIGMLVAYFAPIFPTAQTIVVFFTIDVIFGYLKNRKEKGEKFQPKKVWKVTMPRVVISIVAIICAYKLDEHSPNAVFELKHYVTWMVLATIVLSIFQNAYKWSGWGLLKNIVDFIENRIENFKDKKDE